MCTSALQFLQGYEWTCVCSRTWHSFTERFLTSFQQSRMVLTADSLIVEAKAKYKMRAISTPCYSTYQALSARGQSIPQEKQPHSTIHIPHIHAQSAHMCCILFTYTKYTHTRQAHSQAHITHIHIHIPSLQTSATYYPFLQC